MKRDVSIVRTAATPSAEVDSMSVVLYPNAKINIGLRVLRRRPDGFHDIETLFWPTQVRDILEVSKSDSLVMRRYGRRYPSDDNDLCLQAYRLLKEDFDIPPVAIDLFKNIPHGAGLGGGSADGAFTLKAINRLYSLGLDDARLAVYAAKLGSDCPFFIYNEPMMGEGRGDILKHFSAGWVSSFMGDKPKYCIRIVTPSIQVSTAEAYRGITPSEEGVGLYEQLSRIPIEHWRETVVNDFEKTVFAEHPELAVEKDNLYRDGALYASMSGSGSSLFGIFPRW